MTAIAIVPLLTGRVGAGALESYGIQARWGGKDVFHSHVFDAHGNGWHIDHAVLNANLLNEARAAGARIVFTTALTSAERSRERWRLCLHGGGATYNVSCRFIVDATGRASALRRFTRVPRRRVDALCGVVGVYARQGLAQTLRVASTAYGWWYASPLPNDRTLVCLMSDIDLIRRLGGHRASGWTALLRDSQLIDDGIVPPVECVQVLPCETSILDQVTGAGWVAIGDAASVFDPLASAGVMKALHNGRTAADGVSDYLRDGSHAGLEHYSRQLSSGFERHLIGRRGQYGIEHRWRDEPFWMRRCA